MSSEIDVADGQIDADHTVPVDAICTGCKQTTVKRAPRSEIHVDQENGSFEHVCHRCQGAEWWNVVAVLGGLIEGDES